MIIIHVIVIAPFNLKLLNSAFKTIGQKYRLQQRTVIPLVCWVLMCTLAPDVMSVIWTQLLLTATPVLRPAQWTRCVATWIRLHATYSTSAVTFLFPPCWQNGKPLQSTSHFFPPCQYSTWFCNVDKIRISSCGFAQKKNLIWMRKENQDALLRNFILDKFHSLIDHATSSCGFPIYFQAALILI